VATVISLLCCKGGNIMTKISEYYNLQKSQHELDFADVPVDGDIQLFIDPFAISQRVETWSKECYRVILSYFQHIVDAIVRQDLHTARYLLSNLHEPNETRFGFSKGKPQGSGFGSDLSEELLGALQDSTAVKTGFISSLEEAEIMIDGVGRDKISDLSTNIIRKYLAEYTKEQCKLHNIPTQSSPLKPYYSIETGEWISDYFEVPIAGNKPLLLVPKIIVRYDPAYNHQKYYRDIVLTFLQAEHLNGNSALVHTLKKGGKVVHKKDIIPSFPCTKENLYRFCKDHPKEMQKYREKLEYLEKNNENQINSEESEQFIAEALLEALKHIDTGNDKASEYHRMIIGIVEFIFYPYLVYPKKEVEINQGRKRIDITMENGAREGIFYQLHDVRNLPCSIIPIECKNYGTDVANPEIDQLAGRFSPIRGKLGFLCCRRFQNRGTFIERCRDVLREEKGLIIPMDDILIAELLDNIIHCNRDNNETKFRQLVNEIWIS
jgi:hypothetical protein